MAEQPLYSYTYELVSMGPRSSDGDRAMSESIGIGLLVGMTVVVTAVVGLNVLVVSEDSASSV